MNMIIGDGGGAPKSAIPPHAEPAAGEALRFAAERDLLLDGIRAPVRAFELITGV